MSSERTPLLRSSYDSAYDPGEDAHAQFCMLVGIPPSDLPTGAKWRAAGPKTLYARATRQRKSQSWTYQFMANFSNTLLLSQVVLGATLTALGASESSHILITVFGVLNTIIAGLVAYIKSRGQPMRSRMFLDDLERVVNEIENSETMWLGITRNVHGYDEIDIEDTVTVRSEVARLTRLYEKAIRNHTLNNPDLYTGGQGPDANNTGLRPRPVPGQPAPLPIPAPPAATPAATAAQAPPPPAPVADVDESPATAKPKPAEPPKDDAKGDTAKSDTKPADDAKSKDDPKPNDDAKPAEPVKDTPKVDEPPKAEVKPDPPASVVPDLLEDEDAAPATKAKFTNSTSKKDKKDDAKKDEAKPDEKKSESKEADRDTRNGNNHDEDKNKDQNI